MKEFTRDRLLLIVLFVLNFACSTSEVTNLQGDSANEDSKTLTSLDYNHLLMVRDNLNSDRFASAYNELVQIADKSLTNGPYTIIHKDMMPPSGSKHDYISIGPYWWPDPDKADGLPWIRRDGEINPMTKSEKSDIVLKSKMIDDVASLGLAYFFSEEKKYAEKAKELLTVWFMDDATKMNPNLNYAQGIPGRNTGRGFGIIELAGITRVISTIEILELNNYLDNETRTGLRAWFTDYLSWLQTSELGLFEKSRSNNHAVWYDVQVVNLLCFLDSWDEAKQILEEVKTTRIDTQIEPDGSQPHELARTKTLSYSTMNLRGFTQLAYLGTKVGVDLWNYKTDNGGGIKTAYEFMKPYASGLKEWEYQQINSLEKAKGQLMRLFEQAGSQFDIPEYCTIGTMGKKKPSSLIFSCN